MEALKTFDIEELLKRQAMLDEKSDARKTLRGRSQLTKIREEAENLIFGAMLSIARCVGATEEEFLKVHHEKWLKNMNERTKGEY